MNQNNRIIALHSHRSTVKCQERRCVSSMIVFLHFRSLRFKQYQTVWNIELELKPILLGIVMASTGNIPPGARPWAKYTRVVSEQDMERNKIWFNVPNMKGSPSFLGQKGPTDKSGLARDFRYMLAVDLISPQKSCRCHCAHLK